MKIRELVIWTKQKEIEALEISHRDSPLDGYYEYWQAKAAGFADVWQYIVFDGKDPHPERYNQENDYWSRVVEGLALVDVEITDES